MNSKIQVYLWDYKRSNYCVLQRKLGLDTIPPVGSEIRIEFKSCRVHDLIFDLESNFSEIVVVEVDDGDGPMSFEQAISIYGRIGFEQLGEIEENDSLAMKEYCFPYLSTWNADSREEAMENISDRTREAECRIDKIDNKLSISLFLNVALIAVLLVKGIF